MKPSLLASLIATALLGGCAQPENRDQLPLNSPAQTPAMPANNAMPSNPLKEAYFGNLHVHTSLSFDAFANGTATTPADAYRWAQGEEITVSAWGDKARIKRPLDWYAVSDHAEYMGMFLQMMDPDSEAGKLSIAPDIRSKDPMVRFKAYSGVLNGLDSGKGNAELANPVIGRSIWKNMVDVADSYNQPGKFTTFPAFEWTSQPGGLNLHRVVLFKDSQGLPELPMTALDSTDPRLLWKWMDAARGKGSSVLAVTHNGNASDGIMFPNMDKQSELVLDKDYASERMRNEPLYEVSQIKGTSETHPVLSPTDEFAGFEIWDYLLDSVKIRVPEHKRGGYARQALLDGLQLEAKGQGNPYRFGMIGDSDTHNAAGNIEEDRYTGKFGLDASAKRRMDGVLPKDPANSQRAREFSSGGLAGIWAESNTREALFSAMQRKETFATSGTRLKIRMFASFDYADRAMEQPNWVGQAYAQGVPMGGDLPVAPAAGKAPTFLIHAIKDPDGANLDRIQIVKGWVKDGKQHEKIYDVAASQGRKPDRSGKLPPVGNTVDAKTATYTNTIGDPMLMAEWTDPDFDPADGAVYYARVLEIPTPRWSTYDYVRLGIEPRKDLPLSIQERGWSSPIWYRAQPLVATH